MDWMEKYEFWKQNEFFDITIRAELNSLDVNKDSKEIEHRFYRELEFGIDGFGGVMGVGTNRMNKYTIGRITMGLGQHLINKYGIVVCQRRGVVIGYDTRNNSHYFARVVANVLSSMGIRVYLHAHARPTPQLSFSVVFWNAVAGVMITSNCNSKEYNGYKIYDEFGCQLLEKQSEVVAKCIASINDYRDIDFSGNSTLIEMGDVTDNYIAAVIRQKQYKNKEAKESLRIVYTPLHGTGNVLVQKTLRVDGFRYVDSVDEQVKPDGNISTLNFPNPEDEDALVIGIQHAERMDADIVLGTDSGCERVGVAIKTANGYKVMTSNQISALLVDFVLGNTNHIAYKKPAIVKNVVSSELGADIARNKGVEVFSTPIGFKYVGEKIQQFERAKREKSSKQDYDFIFGYEESCRYLSGVHVLEADAVVSSLLICEMAAKFKAEGKTLIDRMNELYAEFGCYKDAIDIFTFDRKTSLRRIDYLMSWFRSNESPFEDTLKVIDYAISTDAEVGFCKMSVFNILKYVLTDGSWIAMCPSSTELKVYYSIKGTDELMAEIRLETIRAVTKNCLDL